MKLPSYFHHIIPTRVCGRAEIFRFIVLVAALKPLKPNAIPPVLYQELREDGILCQKISQRFGGSKTVLRRGRFVAVYKASVTY